jgi:hypothetical protein
MRSVYDERGENVWVCGVCSWKGGCDDSQLGVGRYDQLYSSVKGRNGPTAGFPRGCRCKSGCWIAHVVAAPSGSSFVVNVNRRNGHLVKLTRRQMSRVFAIAWQM